MPRLFPLIKIPLECSEMSTSFRSGKMKKLAQTVMKLTYLWFGRQWSCKAGDRQQQGSQGSCTMKLDCSLAACTWFTWALRWARRRWARSRGPGRSLPWLAAGTARILANMVMVRKTELYFYQYMRKALRLKKMHFCKTVLSLVVDLPRLIGSSSGGAWESSSRSW